MDNWAKNVRLGEANQVETPETEQELIALLSKNYHSIKVLGSGMSYLPIGQINSFNSLLLDLNLYNGLTEYGEREATFGGQTTLEEITQILLKKGMQLTTSPGVLLTQTIAGAMATGTHGQGYRNGGFSDICTKIRVILASGEVKVYLPTDEEFDCFRIHLGALGIITHVTIKFEPSKLYRLEKGVVEYIDLLDGFEYWNQTNIACKAWWFPKNDKVQLWKTFRATPKECSDYKGVMYTLKDSGLPSSNSVEFMKGLTEMVEQLDSDTKGHEDTDSNTSTHVGVGVLKKEEGSTTDDSSSVVSTDTDLEIENVESNSTRSSVIDTNAPNARFRTVLRFNSLESCVGNLYELWCKGIPAPQVNCEIAIPMHRFKEALQKLRNYYQESGREVHYPFILRATGKSPAWMSASYNGPVCYIGFLVYLAENDYSANEDRLEFLKDIEGLLSEFDSVPHYGKFFSVEKYDLKKRLPRMYDFVQIRDRLDPNSVFMNEYLGRLLYG
jgi:FAD/FMN-containing dehydrogenase